MAEIVLTSWILTPHGSAEHGKGVASGCRVWGGLAMVAPRVGQPLDVGFDVVRYECQMQRQRGATFGKSSRGGLLISVEFHHHSVAVIGQKMGPREPPWIGVLNRQSPR